MMTLSDEISKVRFDFDVKPELHSNGPHQTSPTLISHHEIKISSEVLTKPYERTQTSLATTSFYILPKQFLQHIKTDY